MIIRIDIQKKDNNLQIIMQDIPFFLIGIPKDSKVNMS